MANDWANACVWKHGQLYRDPNTIPYSTIGQNLYAISGTSFFNVTSAILDWYNERPYFNYDTLACQEGQQCGYYTQVSESVEKGHRLKYVSLASRSHKL